MPKLKRWGRPASFEGISHSPAISALSGKILQACAGFGPPRAIAPAAGIHRRLFDQRAAQQDPASIDAATAPNHCLHKAMQVLHKFLDIPRVIFGQVHKIVIQAGFSSELPFQKADQVWAGRASHRSRPVEIAVPQRD